MFRNLQIYDSHLIFEEIEKYDLKISAIPKTAKNIQALLFNNLKRKSLNQDSHQYLQIAFIF